MKKLVLVVFVSIVNIVFVSCENDDEFYEELNDVEIVAGDGDDQILPPRKRK